MINVIRGGWAAGDPKKRERARRGEKVRTERERESLARRVSLQNCSLLLAAAIDVPR